MPQVKQFQQTGQECRESLDIAIAECQPNGLEPVLSQKLSPKSSYLSDAEVRLLGVADGYFAEFQSDYIDDDHYLSGLIRGLQQRRAQIRFGYVPVKGDKPSYHWDEKDEF